MRNVLAPQQAPDAVAAMVVANYETMLDQGLDQKQSLSALKAMIGNALTNRERHSFMGWTDASTEQLKELWHEGLSASEIATKLGNGVTRGAVCRRVSRIGLRRNSVVPFSLKNGPSKAKATKKPKPKPKPKPKLKLVEPVSSAVSDGVLNLETHSCRWPIGDPRSDGFHFCGSRQKEGKPYCEAHCEVAYQPRRFR